MLKCELRQGIHGAGVVGAAVIASADEAVNERAPDPSKFMLNRWALGSVEVFASAPSPMVGPVVALDSTRHDSKLASLRPDDLIVMAGPSAYVVAPLLQPLPRGERLLRATLTTSLDLESAGGKSAASRSTWAPN